MKHEADTERVIAGGINRGLKRFIFPFALVFLVVALLGDALGYFGYGKDSTDPVDGRSGLGLRTDAMTGCQYLESQDGALTPRLNRRGEQVCK